MFPSLDAIPDLTVTVTDGVLVLKFGRHFDSVQLRGDWARTIVTQYPGPFREVRLDLSAQPRLTSNFFAGLMVLHFTYTEAGAAPLVVIKADRNTRTNLRVLQLERFFVFVD